MHLISSDKAIRRHQIGYCGQGVMYSTSVGSGPKSHISWLSEWAYLGPVLGRFELNLGENPFPSGVFSAIIEYIALQKS